MRISTKYSTAIHILIAISEFSSEKKMTSEALAKSAGCNAVIVRNILCGLKKAGIISIARGKGGALLAKNPDEINLLMVYNAVETTPVGEIIGIHKSPSAKCPVGRTINEVLAGPYDDISNSIKRTMQSITLARILEDYHSQTLNLDIVS